MAQVLPDRVMAPGFDGLWDTQITGVERGTGYHFSFTWLSAGGTGVLRGQDGLSVTNVGNANHLSCSTPLRLVTPAPPPPARAHD